MRIAVVAIMEFDLDSRLVEELETLVAFTRTCCSVQDVTAHWQLIGTLNLEILQLGNQHLI